jgi:aryl-alcohol dehydrogenase-like predicted oxidoreductase
MSCNYSTKGFSYEDWRTARGRRGLLGTRRLYGEPHRVWCEAPHEQPTICRGASNDRDQSIAVLRRAVELGVNHVDTAALYFTPLRLANELINRALAPYPEDLVITTKVGPGRDPWGQ